MGHRVGDRVCGIVRLALGPLPYFARKELSPVFNVLASRSQSSSEESCLLFVVEGIEAGR